MTIELQDIHKRFGSVIANDAVSLSLRSGTIHGLLGENGAGKSTLVKVLSGCLAPDRGRVVIDGRTVAPGSPRDAVDLGIGMLSQDPLDVPAFSVLDNFMFGARQGLLPDRRRARGVFGELARRLRFDLDDRARVAALSVGERQQLEILRLVSLGVRVLILDEPTTAVSPGQRAQLFTALRALSGAGHAVVFVSHKLEEVQSLCDEVTVLSHGRVAGHVRMPCATEELVHLMFGRAVVREPHATAAKGDTVVELEDVRLSDWRLDLDGLSLSVHAGEVIGLAGLEGSGQRLALHACCGLIPPRAGRIRLAGRNMTGQSYRAFLASGVQYVPAVRLEEGLIAGMTISEHVALAPGNSRFIVDWSGVERMAARLVEDYHVVGGPGTSVEQLSGGNQQRVLLALLPPDLRLLLLEHPTHGLDLESSQDVWRRLIARTHQGTAIVFSSSDLEELLDRSDRILVFFSGRVALVDARTTDADQLGGLIGGRGV